MLSASCYISFTAPLLQCLKRPIAMHLPGATALPASQPLSLHLRHVCVPSCSVPLYYEAKLLLLVWMMAPQTKVGKPPHMVAACLQVMCIV